MILSILKKDLKNNYLIVFILFLFIMLSVVLISSGSIMVSEIVSSMTNFFDTAKAPHFVQMHTGAIDEHKINAFVESNKLVETHQISRMMTIDNQNIYFNGKKSDPSSVMDNSFVMQNKKFDYLLSLDNQVIHVKSGEIAVPLYYKTKYDLAIGDEVIYRSDEYKKTFKISHFLRDAQMNASIISSKRFVINASDYYALAEINHAHEYLIEFMLTDAEKIDTFEKDYLDAGLPSKGPTIDYTLIQLMNALSDGIVAVIIVFVSLFLTMIAMLCIRFSIMTTMAEDIGEIGAMKAIGLPYSSIKKIYFAKYLFITFLATILGYLFSLKFSYLLTKNISLYMGRIDRGLETYLTAMISALFILVIILLFCMLVLKKIKSISPLEVLNGKNSINRSNQQFKFNHLIAFQKLKKLPIGWSLSLKDLIYRKRMYFLVFLIIMICIYIIIVPINFLTTLSSPDFVSYMGVANSDIRIDMVQNDNTINTYQRIIYDLKQDDEIERVNGFITSQYEVLNSDGYYETMTIETGNYKNYPLKYLKGKAPIDNHQIALSKLNADAFDKKVGDHLTVIVNNQQKNLTISGIYQDITNGGKTAKAIIPYQPDTVIWTTINLSMKSDISIKDKIHELRRNYPNVKVTGIQTYLEQTLSGTIKQVKLITYIAVVIGYLLIILIISLFTKMILIKDHYEIAILKSIGFNREHITRQYIYRLLTIAVIAIIVSTVLANTTGEYVVSLLMSFLGASKIAFTINPFIVYLAIPSVALMLIMISIIIVTRAIGQIKVRNVFNN